MTKILLLAVILWQLVFPMSGLAQNPAGDATAVVRELQAQQVKLDENQTKIQSQVTQLIEIVRQARIYASRGGGLHKAPK